MQVGLGIATLLLYVPVPVAASHQVLNLLMIAKICLIRTVVNLNASGLHLFKSHVYAATVHFFLADGDLQQRE
jgi:heme A synthase